MVCQLLIYCHNFQIVASVVGGNTVKNNAVVSDSLPEYGIEIGKLVSEFGGHKNAFDGFIIVVHFVDSLLFQFESESRWHLSGLA